MSKLIPILFQPEMALANLQDRKTETRRLITERNSVCTAPLAELDFNDAFADNSLIGAGFTYLKAVRPEDGTRHRVFCKIEPGDILWQRENFIVQQVNRIHTKGEWWQHICIDFPASVGQPSTELRYWFWFKEKEVPKVLRRKHPDKVFTSPNIFLPIGCCRCFLKVKTVHAERLHDITDNAAKSEGISRIYNTTSQVYKNYLYPDDICNAKDSYKTLWQKINGEESWEANPWVWVIKYERCEKPAGAFPNSHISSLSNLAV